MPRLSLMQRHPRQKVPLGKLRLLARRLCTVLNFRKGDIHFLFAGQRQIRKLHQRYLHKKTATDVMTFVDRGSVDIVISIDQAQAQAKPRGVKLLEELTLLMCHALLHAQGLNDQTESGRFAMRKAEFESLARVL